MAGLLVSLVFAAIVMTPAIVGNIAWRDSNDAD